MRTLLTTCDSLPVNIHFFCFVHFSHHDVIAQKAIEDAVVAADKEGVKVCGLGALNKAHWINHGGDDILKHHPHLRTRVVHGNTMTAAAVLASVPRGTTDVVMTGCTSKVGRALAIRLALDGCTVQMLTESQQRFQDVVNDVAEIDASAARRLVRQTDLSAPGCRQSPVWIIGKWMQNADQKHIPKGAVVLNYCFPPPPGLRHDVTCVTSSPLLRCGCHAAATPVPLPPARALISARFRPRPITATRTGTSRARRFKSTPRSSLACMQRRRISSAAPGTRATAAPSSMPLKVSLFLLNVPLDVLCESCSHFDLLPFIYCDF